MNVKPSNIVVINSVISKCNNVKSNFRHLAWPTVKGSRGKCFGRNEHLREPAKELAKFGGRIGRERAQLGRLNLLYGHREQFREWESFVNLRSWGESHLQLQRSLATEEGWKLNKPSEYHQWTIQSDHSLGNGVYLYYKTGYNKDKTDYIKIWKWSTVQWCVTKKRDMTSWLELPGDWLQLCPKERTRINIDGNFYSQNHNFI